MGRKPNSCIPWVIRQSGMWPFQQFEPPDANIDFRDCILARGVIQPSQLIIIWMGGVEARSPFNRLPVACDCLVPFSSLEPRETCHSVRLVDHQDMPWPRYHQELSAGPPRKSFLPSPPVQRGQASSARKIWNMNIGATSSGEIPIDESNLARRRKVALSCSPAIRMTVLKAQ